MARLDGIDCIGYIRVSTDRQAGEGQTSPADQASAIDALAAKLGRTVGAWYRDERSGSTVEQRPALMQLLADCAASPRKVARPAQVLVLNDSRFGRFPDPEEAAYWRVHLGKMGWHVRFAEGDETTDVKVRAILRSVVASQATQKREDVRANARRGSRGTASLGFWATLEPYGYRRRVVYPLGRERTLARGQRKAIDEKVVLVPEPTEAGVVREVFLRYATGTDTLATLVEWLRLDVPARKWTRAAVRYTLMNPAYVGDVVSGKTTAAGTSERTEAPEGDWIVRKDAHPALVSRTLFSAVQDVLARNKRWTNRVRTDWLVSGLVQCLCGRPYVASGGNNTRSGRVTRSYRCVTKTGVASDRCAVPGGIKKEWLEGAVIDTVARIVGAPAHRRRLTAHLDHALVALRAEPEASATQLQQEIAEGTRSRDRLVHAVADGTLTGDEARSRLDAVRRLLARLEARRDALATDRTNQRALDTGRERLLALVLDFRQTAATLTGPALRELLRPWIARAVFDPRDRTLTLDVRHLPTFTHGDLTQMPCLSTQTHARDAERVTRRTVVVGGPR